MSNDRSQSHSFQGKGVDSHNSNHHSQEIVAGPQNDYNFDNVNFYETDIHHANGKTYVPQPGLLGNHPTPHHPNSYSQDNIRNGDRSVENQGSPLDHSTNSRHQLIESQNIVSNKDLNHVTQGIPRESVITNNPYLNNFKPNAQYHTDIDNHGYNGNHIGMPSGSGSYVHYNPPADYEGEYLNSVSRPLYHYPVLPHPNYPQEPADHAGVLPYWNCMQVSYDSQHLKKYIQNESPPLFNPNIRMCPLPMIDNQLYQKNTLQTFTQPKHMVQSFTQNEKMFQYYPDMSVYF